MLKNYTPVGNVNSDVEIVEYVGLVEQSIFLFIVTNLSFLTLPYTFASLDF